MRRVVVTGIGTVNPIGNSVKETKDSLMNNRCGIHRIEKYDTTGFKCKLAGQVDIDVSEFLSKRDIRRMDRFSQLGMIASKEAILDSKFQENDTDLAKCSVIMATGMGGLITLEDEFVNGETGSFDHVNPFYVPMVSPNMLAANISIVNHFTGGSFGICAACAGGLYAIGESYRRIKDGYAEVVLCGGADASITRLTIGGFTSMMAVTCTEDVTRASIPFDKERNGFVIGEGAACLVLEEMEHAVNRNAQIYAEVRGYGESCDAYHITMPKGDGSGMKMAIINALSDANMKAENIDCIHAHGTSTKLNDSCESKVIQEIFGEKNSQPYVSASKSMTGHLVGAAGALSTLISILTIKEQFVPATINIRSIDPECDINLALDRKECKVDNVLVNAFGFGGQNASLILSKI